ncbi:MAG TPA: nitroreductase [Acidimicrobiales bacterium]|nr:nitroreductase [Acidimicrobiales bacterium]
MTSATTADEATTPAFDALAELVRARRSNLRMDADRPVPAALVQQVCELAMWAPNHMRTHPWRFAEFTGDGRRRLGAALEDAMVARGETDPERLKKARTKYLRAPTMLLVGSAAHDDPILHDENRDAVAAGVENLLLGATALGLASYWSTGEIAGVAEVKALAGFGPRDQLVAVIYLGWPTGPLPAPPKETPPITVIDH